MYHQQTLPEQFILGIKTLGKAIDWMFHKWDMLAVSLALLVLTILQYASYLCVSQPTRMIKLLGVSFLEGSNQFVQSAGVILFALMSYCILAMMLVLIEITWAYLHQHTAYINYDLKASFTKILKLGPLIPFLMLINFGLAYINAYATPNLLLAIVFILMVTHFILAVIVFNKRSLKTLASTILYGMGALIVHLGSLVWILPNILLYYSNFNPILQKLSGWLGFIAMVAILIYKVILVVLSFASTIVILFALPIYTIYGTFIYAMEIEAGHYTKETQHD